MKLPLHYQILIAMVAAAIVGLIANPGPSLLPDARYRRVANGDFIEQAVDGDKADQERVTLAAAGEDAEALAAQGQVLDRHCRFRIETDRIEVVYSRRYEDADGTKVTMLSRLTVPREKSLAKAYPWLGPKCEEYKSSIGRRFDGFGRMIGGLFLRLLKMVTVPLIATSLVSAVAGMGTTERLGGLFSRTLAYYFVTSILAITTGLVLVNLIAPGVGAELPGAAEEVIGGEGANLPEIFLGLVHRMIPTNPVKAFAEGEFLSIITFSILIGLFLQRCRGRISETLTVFFSDAFVVMMELTQWVIKLAPIGVAGFMLAATVSQGADVFGTLGWYMLTVFLALIVHACLILPLVLRYVARRNPWEYSRAMTPALLTAFSTASSNGTLPLTMSCVEERAGVPGHVGSFVLPLGATINMDGTALYEVVAVLFIAQATPGVSLGIEQQVLVAVTALLASVGAAGIPHAGLVMMAIVLQAVGLPLEAQGLILAVDRILDMCRTSVNVWSDACGCAVVARFEPTLDSAGEESGEASGEVGEEPGGETAGAGPAGS